MKKNNFGYVDGFILPVPKSKLTAYKKICKVACKVWMDHGAINYVEAVGDDVPEGKVTSFAKSVKLKKGEVVIFAWVTYKSRAHRNTVMKKVMTDPRMEMMVDGVPFDGMRMFWGGFKPIMQA